MIVRGLGVEDARGMAEVVMWKCWWWSANDGMESQVKIQDQRNTKTE